MIWESWNAFFNMGGYGLYVWGSVLLTFALMAGEMVSMAMRWKAGMAHLGKRSGEEGDDDENQG